MRYICGCDSTVGHTDACVHIRLRERLAAVEGERDNESIAHDATKRTLSQVDVQLADARERLDMEAALAAGVRHELAEARARCVELEGRVAAAERLAEEERGRSDRWKEAAELAARIAAPDAARKDLETARSVFSKIAQVRTCDHESCDYCGCDVGGGLYASGEEPEHHEDWCPTALAMRFLAAHPVKSGT